MKKYAIFEKGYNLPFAIIAAADHLEALQRFAEKMPRRCFLFRFGFFHCIADNSDFIGTDKGLQFYALPW